MKTKILILLTIFSLTFISCKKKEDGNKPLRSGGVGTGNPSYTDSETNNENDGNNQGNNQNNGSSNRNALKGNGGGKGRYFKAKDIVNINQSLKNNPSFIFSFTANEMESAQKIVLSSSFDNIDFSQENSLKLYVEIKMNNSSSTTHQPIYLGEFDYARSFVKEIRLSDLKIPKKFKKGLNSIAIRFYSPSDVGFEMNRSTTLHLQ